MKTETVTQSRWTGSPFVWCFIAVCSALIAGIVTLTPMVWDDYQFQFTITTHDGSGMGFSGVRWQSFDDFLYAFIHHRDIQNCRFANHAFLLCTYLGGINLCTVLNSIFIVITWLATVKFSMGRLTVLNAAVGILAAALMLSAPDRVLFWRDGCFNYIWGCFFLVLFLFELRKEQYSAWKLFLLAFLCGGWNEGLSVPLCGALMGYPLLQWLMHRPCDTRKYIISALIITVALAWLCTSPRYMNGRVGHVAEHAGEVLYYFGSVYRMILYCLPTCIVFLILLWVNRKKLLTDFLYILAIANFIPTVLLFARGGAWGGGSFYCSFIILLCALEQLRFLSTYRNKVLTGLCSVSAMALLGYMFFYVQDIRRVYDSIMAEKSDAPVRRCDYFKNGEVPWLLKTAFYGNEVPFTCAGQFFGGVPFTVVFNQVVHDEAVYSAFDSYAEDETVWLKMPRMSVIRYAAGVEPVFKHPLKGKTNSISGGGRSVKLLCHFSSDWLSYMIYKMLGGYMTEHYSYANGHYFELLPESANAMDKMEVELRRIDNRNESFWEELHPATPEG